MIKMNEVAKSKSKIGFWALLSIVISAELGASIFLLPSALAPFGTFGLVGWLIGGIGAVLIAVIFAFLCLNAAKNGGPHIYAKTYFGDSVGFFVTWIYWCGSWACNPILIATSINYLMSFVGDMSVMTKLMIEISIVLSLTCINTRGIKTSGNVEILLTIMKILPLIAIPIFAFKHIDMSHFGSIIPHDSVGMKAIIGATIISFWGFVGLEGATSPAEFAIKPRKNIPLAIVLGTFIVAVICFINTFAIFGIIPLTELQNIGAPFAHVMVVLFGGSYEKLIGALTFVMCFGSLNAWVLFSGQIARSAAVDGLLPKFFGKLNKNEAPANAFWISALGTIFILCVLKLPGIKNHIETILEMSVVVYIAIYTMSILVYVKFMKQKKILLSWQMLIVLLALGFCFFIIFNTAISHFLFLFLMLLTGIPVYLKLKRKI